METKSAMDFGEQPGKESEVVVTTVQEGWVSPARPAIKPDTKRPDTKSSKPKVGTDWQSTLEEGWGKPK
jgi:hypothetical protein